MNGWIKADQKRALADQHGRFGLTMASYTSYPRWSPLLCVALFGVTSAETPVLWPLAPFLSSAARRSHDTALTTPTRPVLGCTKSAFGK